MARGTITALGDNGSYATLLASGTITIGDVSGAELVAVGTNIRWPATGTATAIGDLAAIGYYFSLGFGTITNAGDLIVGGGRHIAIGTSTAAGTLAAIGTNLGGGLVSATGTITNTGSVAASGTQLASGTSSAVGDLAATSGSITKFVSGTITVGVGAAGDPLWSEVQLLAKFDGADAGTSYTELSQNTLAATFVANAQLDTADKKFGSASALFDGVGDQITFPNDAALELGTSDFTIEFFFETDSLPSNPEEYFIVGHLGTTGNQPWAFGLKADAISSNRIRVVVDGGGEQQTLINTTTAINTWYHVVIERSGDDYYVGFNGYREFSNIGWFGASPVQTSDQALTLGVNANKYSWTDFDGHIDNLRITIGSARYGLATNSTYTVPASDFPVGSGGAGDELAATGTNLASGTISVLGDQGSTATVLASGTITCTGALAGIGTNVGITASGTITNIGSLTAVGFQSIVSAVGTITVAGALTTGGGQQAAAGTSTLTGSLSASGTADTSIDAAGTIVCTSSLFAAGAVFCPITAKAAISITATLAAFEDSSDDIVTASGKITVIDYERFTTPFTEIVRSSDAPQDVLDLTNLGWRNAYADGGPTDSEALVIADTFGYVTDEPWTDLHAEQTLAKAEVYLLWNTTQDRYNIIFDAVDPSALYVKPYREDPAWWLVGDEWVLFQPTKAPGVLRAKLTHLMSGGNYVAKGSITCTGALDADLRKETCITPTATITVDGAVLSAGFTDPNLLRAKGTITVPVDLAVQLAYPRSGTVSLAGELKARGYLLPQGDLGLVAQSAETRLASRAGPGTIDGKKQVVIDTAYGSIEIYNNSNGGFYSIGLGAITREVFGTVIWSGSLVAVGTKDSTKTAMGSIVCSSGMDAVGTTNLPISIILGVGDLAAKGRHTGITATATASGDLAAIGGLVVSFSITDQTIYDTAFQSGFAASYYKIDNDGAAYRRAVHLSPTYTSIGDDYVEPKDQGVNCHVRATRLSGDAVPNLSNPGLGSWLSWRSGGPCPTTAARWCCGRFCGVSACSSSSRSSFCGRTCGASSEWSRSAC